MHLTNEQIEEFKRNGFLVLPAQFSAGEIQKMSDEADRILNLVVNTTLALGKRDCRLDVQDKAGKLNVRKVQPINDLSKYLADVSNDERLVGPLRQLMEGHEPILMEEKLNYKQVLHQDIDIAPFQPDGRQDLFFLHHDWGYYRQQGYPQAILSSAISIDDSTPENGPLRVVPGTHGKDYPTLNPDPLSGDGRVSEDLFTEAERIPIIAPAGSVMLFHSMLLHDSVSNETGRPRRIMIYSHYPAWHQAEPDQRNKWGREVGQQQENEYRDMVAQGKYADKFDAFREPK